MTRANDIVCVHEPFSDAYHWGPEKLTERYDDVEKLRVEKGYEDYTYHTALQIINDAKVQVRASETVKAAQMKLAFTVRASCGKTLI